MFDKFFNKVKRAWKQIKTALLPIPEPRQKQVEDFEGLRTLDKRTRWQIFDGIEIIEEQAYSLLFEDFIPSNLDSDEYYSVYFGYSVYIDEDQESKIWALFSTYLKIGKTKKEKEKFLSRAKQFFWELTERLYAAQDTVGDLEWQEKYKHKFKFPKDLDVNELWVKFEIVGVRG